MNLKRKIIENLPRTPEGIEIFMFGSILGSEEKNDIDLAIIYNKKIIDLKTAIKIRQEIRDNVKSITNLESDILLLSQEENEEVEFIQNVRTERINASR